MSWNNVIPIDMIRGGVWKGSSVDETPVIELSDWMVVEVTPGNDRHFIGWNLTEGEGRTSSKLASFDSTTTIGTTSSGRKYKLVGEPGINGDALYTFTHWCRVNGVQSYEDVSDEYR